MVARGCSASLVSGPEPSSGSSAPLEGAERRKMLRLSLHLAVPRALRARRLAALHLWRLPPRNRLVGPEPGTFISVIPAACAALHPNRTCRRSQTALLFKWVREPSPT